MRKPLSIKQLLLLAFLLAGLLPAILVSFLSFFQAKDALKKEISHDLQTLSISVAKDVERVMFERIQNVHSWSQLAIMQDLQIGDVDKRLATFLKESQTSYNQEYHALHVVDTKGLIVASSSAAAIGQSFVQIPDWFDVNVGSKVVHLSKIHGQIMYISQSIVDSNTGEVLGTFVAEFNWAIISKLLNETVQNPASAALIDMDGQDLAVTDGWDELGYAVKVEQPILGKITLPGWRIDIKKLHTVAVAPVHRLGYVFLALLLVTVIFSTLLVRPIGRAIALPIEALTKFVSSFQREYPSPPPKSGPPEVQALSVAFESMMKDLKKSEEKLKQAAKLAVVGEMAAAMSHEVRTPLGILRSSADVLLREPDLSQDGKEVLGFIISETERLNNLVSSLIDAARPRSPNFTEVNITQVIEHVMALLRKQAELKSISIVFNSLVDQPLYLLADKEQMTQVVMNLLMNAIQILPKNGHVEINLNEQEKEVILEVADDGPGITTENQGQVFEPFFTQRSGGVGLGLAVVRQIIQAHQGEISYQVSHLGGAQFTMRFQKTAS
jgi:two-component system, NtrC family, sensor histidine kinase HydH